MFLFENRRQQSAVAVGTLLLILAALYAPWIGTHRDNDDKVVGIDRQYNWVFNAPSGESKESDRRISRIEEGDSPIEDKARVVGLFISGVWTWQIDWPVLFIEWTTIVCATLGALVLLKRSS